MRVIIGLMHMWVSLETVADELLVSLKSIFLFFCTVFLKKLPICDIKRDVLEKVHDYKTAEENNIITGLSF